MNNSYKRNCSFCGLMIRREALICPYCNNSGNISVGLCSNCGLSIKKDKRACEGCGYIYKQCDKDFYDPKINAEDVTTSIDKQSISTNVIPKDEASNHVEVETSDKRTKKGVFNILGYSISTFLFLMGYPFFTTLMKGSSKLRDLPFWVAVGIIIALVLAILNPIKENPQGLIDRIKGWLWYIGIVNLIIGFLAYFDIWTLYPNPDNFEMFENLIFGILFLAIASMVTLTKQKVSWIAIFFGTVAWAKNLVESASVIADMQFKMRPVIYVIIIFQYYILYIMIESIRGIIGIIKSRS